MPKLDMNISTDRIKEICSELGMNIKKFAEEHEELSWRKEDCQEYKFETQYGMIDIVFNNANKKIKAKIDCSNSSDEIFEDLKGKVIILKKIVTPKDKL